MWNAGGFVWYALKTILVWNCFGVRGRLDIGLLTFAVKLFASACSHILLVPLIDI